MTELGIVVHPLISVRRRQRQSELFEFKANLVYRVSFKIVRTAHTKKTLSQKTKQNRTKTHPRMEVNLLLNM